MVGVRHGSEICVRDLVVCDNLAVVPDEFILSPRDYSGVSARLRGPETIVGVFHSHLGTAEASGADARGIRLHRLVWLIVGNTRCLSIRRWKYAAYMMGRRGDLVRLPVRWRSVKLGSAPWGTE
jgi:proteasome lid subunit RPN8/RPN11